MLPGQNCREEEEVGRRYSEKSILHPQAIPFCVARNALTHPSCPAPSATLATTGSQLPGPPAGDNTCSTGPQPPLHVDRHESNSSSSVSGASEQERKKEPLHIHLHHGRTIKKGTQHSDSPTVLLCDEGRLMTTLSMRLRWDRMLTENGHGFKLQKGFCRRAFCAP
eukprot:1143009-Pelagomonas_calceolata.AAC.2